MKVLLFLLPEKKIGLYCFNVYVFSHQITIQIVVLRNGDILHCYLVFIVTA